MPPPVRWIDAIVQIEALKVQVRLLTQMVNALNGIAASKMPGSPPLPPLPPAPQ